ncbi:hypothetical protein BROC_00064 [Candidatus Brocadiaceae bacterium]|nr:hypothetical protein BROC_00064 [Candidatus Brocadiaceae bacterium]
MIKIAIGIITCNRQELFRRCMDTLPAADYVHIIVDGKPYEDENVYGNRVSDINFHMRNMGVAKSKNEALTIMMRTGAEHLFLCEDDIAFNNPDVTKMYIDSAMSSGVYHLNFGYHGPANKNAAGEPNPRMRVMMEDGHGIVLNRNIVGAFSYYHRSLLEKVGFMDERFLNAWEHVDHTYRIIKQGYHPPFWWFADSDEGSKYIIDQDATLEQSVIRRKGWLWKWRFRRSTKYFIKKYGLEPHDIPEVDPETALDMTRDLCNSHGRSKIDSIKLFEHV